MLLLWGKYVRKYYRRFLIFFLIGLASLLAVDYYQLKIPKLIGEIVDVLQTTGSVNMHTEFFRNLMIELFIDDIE